VTLPSLPAIKVYIAFNPTLGGNTLATANQVSFVQQYGGVNYWTDASVYLRDFTTKTGKQHYLDRIEATTLKMTLNNRDGFFNGSPNVITPRLPIAITGTWASTGYNVFWGIIDSITEKLSDALNSDLDVEASDLLKYLSLKYLYRPSFWKQYATSTSVSNWYRCSNYSVATVTAATALSSSSIKYQVVNTNTTFSVGSTVTVTGLSGLSTLNQANATISAADSTSFTVSGVSTTSGASATSSGVAYVTTAYDYVGGKNGTFNGLVAYPNHGALIYDTDGCVSLSGQGNVASGSVNIVPTFSSPNYGAIDFWILGQQTNSNTILFTNYGGSNSNNVTMSVNANGYIAVAVNGTPVSISGAPKVNDGYWHHVGLVVIGSGSTGTVNLYCDGQFFPTSLTGTYLNLVTGGLNVGATVSGSASYNGYIDEIVVSNLSSLSTLTAEVQQRYRAGTMLQLGFPVTSTKVYSGDRIAEVLTLAGFGSITGGTTSALSSLNVPNYYIANGYQNYVAYGSATYKGYASTEPYYWDSPIDSSTALDLIQQITDTDIGSFFQRPDGTFYFLPQNYYGTWSFTYATPPSASIGTWTLGSFTTATISDNGNGYPYDVQGLQVIQDDTDLWTSVRITPQAGVDQIFEYVGQEARWGYSTLTKSSTVSSSLQDALSSAYFLAYLYKAPLPRVNNVTLTSEATVGGNQGYNLSLMLGLNFGDALTFQRTQPNATGSGIINRPMSVESISHEFAADPGYWHTHLILDPYPVRGNGSIS